MQYTTNHYNSQINSQVITKTKEKPSFAEAMEGDKEMSSYESYGGRWWRL